MHRSTISVLATISFFWLGLSQTATAWEISTGTATVVTQEDPEFVFTDWSILGESYLQSMQHWVAHPGTQGNTLPIGDHTVWGVFDYDGDGYTERSTFGWNRYSTYTPPGPLPYITLSPDIFSPSDNVSSLFVQGEYSDGDLPEGETYEYVTILHPQPLASGQPWTISLDSEQGVLSMSGDGIRFEFRFSNAASDFVNWTGGADISEQWPDGFAVGSIDDLESLAAERAVVTESFDQHFEGQGEAVMIQWIIGSEEFDVYGSSGEAIWAYSITLTVPEPSLASLMLLGLITPSRRKTP